MKKYVIASAVVFACSSWCVYAGHYATNLAGNYDCKGKEIGTEDAFKCKMNLTKTGQTYAQHLTCNDGTSYNGTGIYDPNKHVLALVAINPKKFEETGVVMLDVQKNGVMTAKWTYINKTTLGYTECTRM